MVRGSQAEGNQKLKLAKNEGRLTGGGKRGWRLERLGRVSGPRSWHQSEGNECP